MSAVVQRPSNAVKRVGGKRLPGLYSGQAQDLGVRRRVIAVHADLTDLLLWRRGVTCAFRRRDRWLRLGESDDEGQHGNRAHRIVALVVASR